MKKTNVIVGLMMLLTVFSVMATVNVESNETSSILVDRFTITTVLNETSTMNYYVSTTSGDYSTTVASGSAQVNGTTHTATITGLAGETTYYWKMNGTSETPETNYETSEVTAVTSNYQVRGTVRTIMSLFVLILSGLVGFSIMFTGFEGRDTSARKLSVRMIIGVVAMLILNAFISAILGL